MEWQLQQFSCCFITSANINSSLSIHSCHWCLDHKLSVYKYREDHLLLTYSVNIVLCLHPNSKESPDLLPDTSHVPVQARRSQSKKGARTVTASCSPDTVLSVQPVRHSNPATADRPSIFLNSINSLILSSPVSNSDCFKLKKNMHCQTDSAHHFMQLAAILQAL